MSEHRLRRSAAAMVAVLLTVSSFLAVAGAPATAAPNGPPDWVDQIGRQGQTTPTAPETPEPAKVPLARSTAASPPTFAFPKAASWDVPGGGGVASGAADERRPVRLAIETSAKSATTLRVRIADRATAERAGASGFVFSVSDPAAGARTPAGRDPATPGRSAGPLAESVPGAAESTGKRRPAFSGTGKLAARITVDYSGFANAYGSDYASRLHVVALPDCALATALPAGCQPAGKPVRFSNDLAAQRLTVEVDDLARQAAGTDAADAYGATATFAVTSSVDGDTGTFGATPMNSAGTWSVSPGSGAFGYSYPIDAPAPGAGDAPSVSLGYSSAAVDGLTVASNTQAGPSGLGWSDFANAYIERSYEPCYLAKVVMVADLCWKGDNATISLGGISGPLIPVNAEHTEWRVQADPGWRITRLTGASYTNIHQGQYWRVLGPDGTRYYFGTGHMPGRQTNSTLSVPVFADHSGEPCRGANNTIGGCDQGWRWYLDRVVDPDGNTQALLYEREDNWFSAVGGIGGNDHYHRSALLKEIIYGGRGWDPASYSARVLFLTQSRCVRLAADCGPATRTNGSSFLDVPNDLICTRTSACTVHAPSFFGSRRYAAVRTEVKVGTAWKEVVQHNLIHRFGNGADGVARKLLLDKIQYAGVFRGLGAYPVTQLTYAHRDNRADHGGIISRAMRHDRLTRITNPTGGRTDVTYGIKDPCASGYEPARWDLNVRDCFPQSILSGGHLRTGIFHKYVVTRVTETPGVGTPMVTDYRYKGTPAWLFDTGSFARGDDRLGWSRWSGYGTVTITKGSAKTRLRMFRGLHGDWALQSDGGNLVPVFGAREASVTTFDETQSYPDERALAGRTLEEQQLGTLSGVPDSPLQSRRHSYERRATHEAPGYLFDPEWVETKSTTERVYSAPGVFRERRSQTTHNDHFQPASTVEEGWLDVTGDERCSITTYADNPDAHMFTYPAMNRTVAGDCASSTVLSQSETYYDGSTTLGAPPTRGNPTRQRTQVEAQRWSQTSTEYDDMGRPVKVTDPTGAETTTTYTVASGAPASQLPSRTAVTNALGHQSVTNWVQELGQPATVVDANGNLTRYDYDVMGRLDAVWLPTEPYGVAEPSLRFTYDLSRRSVRTRQLVSDTRTGADVRFRETWVIYDGFWREIQTQGRSTVSGRTLVSGTVYDNRGQVRDELVEQAFQAAPGAYISGGSAWLNRTRHHYDELGRETSNEWFRGGTPVHSTRTEYGLDTVTVTGPNGRQVRERVDGLGRTVVVQEYDGQQWVGSSYGYDLADRLLSATDPAGNRITYGYNLAGWRTSQQDPNRGNGSFTYDDAGRQLRVTDARGNRIHNVYDALGRQVERRSGSPTGALLASWDYDAAPGGKGLPHRQTSHTNTGNWVSEVTGYDIKGRATGERITVPAGLPGLSGTYAVSRTYDRADRVRTMTLPAIGGLSQETVTTTYNDLGLPTRMTGLAEYVWSVGYDDRGRKLNSGYGPRPGGATWLGKTWTYDVDQRRNGSETYVAGSATPNGIVSDHELTFDVSGNLAEKVVRQQGQSWRECYGYDARSRLTSAHTVTSTASCNGGTPGTGDQSYRHSYRYSPDGRLLERVEQGVSTAYTYPAAGTAKPHAPTKVGNDTYSWDEAGNLVARGVTGQVEWFSWDISGQLAWSQDPAGGRTEFSYDVSGQRLLRRTPDGKRTAYLFGHEVTASADGSQVSAVRPYTFDGDLVATRTAAGVDYLVSDPGGSVELAVPSGGTAPTGRRSYAPYGKVRSESGDLATDRGFLGQVEDASTGLSYLNARYYDTRIGLFISTDPIYNTQRIQTLNPYSYSVNNPTTYSDPGGLYSGYTFGLEVENGKLRAQNKDLIAHIGKLGNHIKHLQDVIRQQRRQINELATYARALEAEIRRQATIIQRLQDRVAYLERVVVAQQREISRLRSVVARQARIIRYQAGVIRRQAATISYYRGVVNQLGFRLWGGTSQYGYVMSSIHSGRGIPSGAFGYDNISIRDAQISGLYGQIGDLNARITSLGTSLQTIGTFASGQMLNSIFKSAQIGRLNGENRQLRDDLDAAGDPSFGDVLKGGIGLVPLAGDALGIWEFSHDLGCWSGFSDWYVDNAPNPLGLDLPRISPCD